MLKWNITKHNPKYPEPNITTYIYDVQRVISYNSSNLIKSEENHERNMLIAAFVF